MKKISLILVLLISSLYSYSGYYAPFSGTKYITQGWKGTWSHGGHSPRYPYALDIVDKVPGRTFDVLAVKSGTVTKIGTHSGFGKYVIIKHTDGLYSQYMHLSHISVSLGSIARGKTIGKSGNTGSYSQGVHLHIQFTTDGSSSKMGSTAGSRMIDFTEFKASTVQYYRSTARIYPIKSKNTLKDSIEGIFDGAGSLVSPDESCYGCDEDIAVMHPHNGVGSTVVFQWLYRSTTCSQIDITANKSIDVVVKEKSWRDHNTKQAFKVRLSSSPITLRRTSSTNPWVTLAVTSSNPISDATEIYAKCRIPGDTYRSGGRIPIEKTLVDVTSDTFWTGTGSLISNANQGNLATIGTGKDYAVTFNSHNSLTSFQWLRTNSCKKIKIEDAGDNSSSNIKSVHMKGWSHSSWGSSKCSSLPCTLSALYEGYYVIKVKSAPGGVKSEMLKATCIQ